MEVVRIIPNPQTRREKEELASSAMHLRGGLLVVAAKTEPLDAAPRLTLEHCTLRMDGDPRKGRGTPVGEPVAAAIYVADRPNYVRLDSCKLENVHPMLQVTEGAQVELHDCHARMVFGTQPLLVSKPGSRVAMTGCTLVEEEGPHLPAASSLPWPDQVSPIYAGPDTTLTLDRTKVCMPLAGKLALDPYIDVKGTFSAIDSEFDSTFLCLYNLAPGPRFVRCKFNCQAANYDPREPRNAAMLYCYKVSGLLVEDCVFSGASYRSAIQVAALPGPMAPPGGPPLARIKGVKVFNCLYGIQVHETDERFGRLTVEVEDSIIKVVQSDLAGPEDRQVGFGFTGAAVSATVRRCTVQAKDEGQALHAVYAGYGAHLAMEDCTVEQEGTSTAVWVGRSTAPTTIQRTTITSSMPGGLVACEAPAGRRPVVFFQGGEANLIDCKIDGSDQHCAVAIQGPGKLELETCEIAVTRPCYRPWAALDPGAVVSLKDCVVGTCINEPQIGYGTKHTLDNTPYPPWDDQFTDAGSQGSRITAYSVPGGKVTYQMLADQPKPTAASSSIVQQGVQAGPSADGQGASNATATADGEGVKAPQSCAYCHAYSPHLQACASCGVALYCNRDCQKKHWKQGHKQACRQG